MMMIDETLETNRYEVGAIINENRQLIITTDDLRTANDYYELTVDKYKDDGRDHVIVFIYDYDRNANINYYDSEHDLSV